MELYEKVREQRNSLNFFARKLGLKITRIDKDYAEGELPVDESFTNPQGSVQGGAMFTLADAVGGAGTGSPPWTPPSTTCVPASIPAF